MYEKIESLLVETHKTAYQLCKDTGINQSVISNWKNGVAQPSLKNLATIAEYFGKPIEYFLS